jgi:hypothetical protein
MALFLETSLLQVMPGITDVPLWHMTLWKRPLAALLSMSMEQLIPPEVKLEVIKKLYMLEVSCRACTLSEYGDVLGIASKILDVFLHPTQRFNLVQETKVARNDIVSSAEESCTMNCMPKRKVI